ncbi:hypothetical protein QCA50_013467 [Cerrena zonata]|uniref:Carboxylic ester hydrolase n=1 Tax=Cerrena zonata TaxID=2478898 RepID=A0AAW0FX07_9APHY
MFLLSPLLLLFPSVIYAQSAPVVDLGYAQYQGTVDVKTGNTHFFGVRYAAPPTGNLRFAAPQPPLNATGVQQAIYQPPRCLQSPGGSAATSPFASLYKRADATVNDDTEDCLYLNVYTPGKLNTTAKLPVVVWLHGGGYALGGAIGLDGTDIQNGDDLIMESGNGVIVVVVQYRLGLFGFLAGQKVKSGGALNAGLLDQQFALQWVQKNIGKFGGDPAAVTLWGVSAGAGAVLQQLIANNGATSPSLFRAAITSSTYLPSQYAYNDVVPESLYSQVVSGAKCSSASDTLACLRKTASADLQAVNVAVANTSFFGMDNFVPVVDGTFITQRPSLAIKSGKLNTKTIYSVTNTLEGGNFVDSSLASTLNVQTFVKSLFPALSDAQALAASQQYTGLGSNYLQAILIMGEAIYECPTYALMKAYGDKGYKGQFSIPPGVHALDFYYYFPSSNAMGYRQYFNDNFQVAFAGSFLKFARFLNPNTRINSTDITPTWAPWSTTHTEMRFNRTDAGAPDVKTFKTDDGLLSRCSFWDSVSDKTAQ